MIYVTSSGVASFRRPVPAPSMILGPTTAIIDGHVLEIGDVSVEGVHFVNDLLTQLGWEDDYLKLSKETIR